MEKVYLDDNVFCVEDFLSKESFDILLSLCKEEDGWRFDNPNVPQKGTKDIDLDDYSDVWDEIRSKMKEIFPDQSEYTLRITGSMSRTLPYQESFNINDVNFSMGPHTDDFGYRKHHNVQDDSIILIPNACIIYLNDEYTGGEIVYPQKNIQVKPKSNMLLCHPGSDEYEHGVTQVYDAIRYTVPFFIINKDYAN